MLPEKEVTSNVVQKLKKTTSKNNKLSLWVRFVFTEDKPGTGNIHLFTYKRVGLWPLHSIPLPKREHHPLIHARQMSYRNLSMTHRVNTDCRNPVHWAKWMLVTAWVKTGDYEKGWRCVKRTLNNCPAFAIPTVTHHTWNVTETGYTLTHALSVRTVRTVSHRRIELESNKNL